MPTENVEMAGAPLPSFSGMRDVRTVWPKPDGKGLQVVGLARVWVAFWTHFHEQRTVPCCGWERGCGFCSGEKPQLPRWQAYLPCILKGKVPAILTISEGCARDLLRVALDNDGLRGVIIQTWRDGPNLNSPQKARFGGLNRHDGLPEAFDPVPCLAKLWRVPEDYLREVERQGGRFRPAGEVEGGGARSAPLMSFPKRA